MYAAVVSKLYRTVPHFFLVRECSLKGTQAARQNHFSLGFSAIYFTNTFILFVYNLLKHSLLLQQSVIVQLFIAFNYMQILVLTNAMVTAV